MGPDTVGRWVSFAILKFISGNFYNGGA